MFCTFLQIFVGDSLSDLLWVIIHLDTLICNPMSKSVHKTVAANKSRYSIFTNWMLRSSTMSIFKYLYRPRQSYQSDEDCTMLLTEWLMEGTAPEISCDVYVHNGVHDYSNMLCYLPSITWPTVKIKTAIWGLDYWHDEIE